MSQTLSLIKRSGYFVILGILTLAAFSESRKYKRNTRRSYLKFDGRSIFGGMVKAYTAPRYWTIKEFLILGGIINGLFLIFLFDESLSRWFIRQEKKALPLLKDFGWYYGSPENHYAINGGFYLYGLLAKNESVRKTGVLLISSTMASGLLQTVIKTMIGRARPLRNEGKFSFKPFSGENSYYSFPSGHSILSFTTAYAIGTQFTNPTYRFICYAFGSIAPFSRLWAGAHWVSDAATSICLSIPIVNTIDKYLLKERNYETGLDEVSSISLKTLL